MNIDEKKIVLVRLQTLPGYIKVSIGKFGTFNKEELMEHVESGDDIGKLIVNVYMNGLR